MYYVKLAPGVLHRLRKRKGLTQKELAQKTGVAAGTICNWERGLCTCSERYIKALAQALDCTVDELSDGAESVTVSRRVSGIKPAPLPKANLIDQYRKACGLTIKDLARKVGTSANTVVLWENGKVTPPAPKALLLAETLGCTVNDLKIPRVFDFDFTNFAYNLRRLRCERGLSRAELSFAIFGNLRTAGLGALERGKYSPSFAQITQIMQALNCTLNDLQLAPDAPADQKLIKTHSASQSKLRHKRLELGLSQAELGRVLGLRGNYISLWEVGAGRPNAASMQKLCDFFHCSPDDLFITPSKSEEKS